jgi:hypothetical protein
MHPEEKPPSTDDLDHEINALLREADERRRRPDHRPPRGNQEVEAADVERGREKLDRVLGW